MHDLAGGDGHKLVAVGRLGRTVIGSEVEGRRLLLLTGCVNSLVEGVLSTAAAQHGEAWLEVATGGLTVGPGLQGLRANKASRGLLRQRIEAGGGGLGHRIEAGGGGLGQT